MERKLTRQEADLQRFRIWKAERIKQKELEKQNAKPPFITVVKPKENYAQQYSFVNKNRIFRSPAGLKDCSKTPDSTLSKKRLSGKPNVLKERDANIKSNEKITVHSPKATKSTANLDKNITIKNGTAPSKTKTNIKSYQWLDLNIFSPKIKNATTQTDLFFRPLCKKDYKSTSAGAVGKASKMRQMNLRNVLPVTKHEGNNPKPHLAASLKTKKSSGLRSTNARREWTNAKLSTCLTGLCEIIQPPKTPTNTHNLENIISFVTSTQMKTSSTLHSYTLDFSELYKTISPVNALKVSECNSKSDPTKLDFLQREANKKKTPKRQKFNFVREIEMDDTTRAAIFRQNSPCEVDEEKSTTDLQPKSQTLKRDNMNSRINKLQVELRKRLFQPVLESPFKRSKAKGKRHSHVNIAINQMVRTKMTEMRKQIKMNTIEEADIYTSPLNSAYRPRSAAFNFSGCTVRDRKSRSIPRSQSPVCSSSPKLKSAIRAFSRGLLNVENALEGNELLKAALVGRKSPQI